MEGLILLGVILTIISLFVYAFFVLMVYVERPRDKAYDLRRFLDYSELSRDDINPVTKEINECIAQGYWEKANAPVWRLFKIEDDSFLDTCKVNARVKVELALREKEKSDD